MKKKIFYISTIIFSLALIVTGVVFLFVVNYNTDIPQAITVSTVSNKTYFKTSLNSNSHGYIYRFVQKDGEEKTFESQSNIICADELIENDFLTLGETYTISVRYKNEYKNGYSNYSEKVEWLASKILEKPVITVVKDEAGTIDEKITWEEVAGATDYVVYYSCGEEIKTTETTNTYLLLKNIEGGEHNFYVVATSSEDKYLSSEMSNVVTATSWHELQVFLSVKFSKTTKKVTISSLEDIDKVEIFIGTNINDARSVKFSYQGDESRNFTKKKTQFGYELSINIFAIYGETDTYIGVKPVASGYNVYNGSIINAQM